jgi:hypothetical protein
LICCGAGVSPAIFPISTQRKNAGETPEPRNPAFLRDLDELHFVDQIRREICGFSARLFLAGIKARGLGHH